MELNTYQSLCAEYYELDKPEAPPDALSFYRSYAKEANGPILEPMCGTGRFLLPILKAGYEIEGHDASSHMLAILHQKAHKSGLQPRIKNQFIETANSALKYNLIFIPSGSFGLLIEETEIQDALNNIYQQLNQGGKFVFEAETPLAIPSQLNIWEGDVRYRDPHTYIMLSTLHLPPEDNVGRVICKYELLASKKVIKTEIEELKVKMYHPDKLISRLKEIGFSEIQPHKAYHRGQQFDEADELIVYECIK